MVAVVGKEIGALRFAVGTWDGPQSTTWRVWATEDGDVYVAQRPIAGEAKASLHKSGKWRFGLTGKHEAGVSLFLEAGQDRASLKWERPRDLVPGLTHAFAVVIPTSEVRAPRHAPSHQDERIVWIPPAPEEEAVEVHLFLATAGPAGHPLAADSGRPTQRLSDVQLPGGDRLLATWHHERLSEAVKAEIEKHRRMMMETVSALDKEIRRNIDPRGYLLNAGTREGVTFLVDVALPVPEEAT